MPLAARQFLSGAWDWSAAIGAGLVFALALAVYSGGAQLGWIMPAMAAQTDSARASVWFSGSQPQPYTRDFLGLLRRADEHGLDPSDYRVAEIDRALAGADGAARVKASSLLSEALLAYARDLRVPRDPADVVYIDRELAPSAPSAEMLAVDASLMSRLRALHASNRPYEDLRAGLAQYRLTWASLPQIQIPDGPSLVPGSQGPRVALLRERLGLQATASGPARYDAALGDAVRKFRDAHGLPVGTTADRKVIEALNRGAAHYERIIIANLDRTRGLPLGDSRYVLVDTAEARLRMIEAGEVAGTMRVVVGKPGMETPLLAGFIRYAIVNPYWNVPPDLVRNSVAPAVLREGVSALNRRNFVLSADWQSDARIDPADVDWPAIAEGRKSIWVRQLPGGRNMMGDVKFMLPNDLGIYLHDTPDKSLFQRDNRRLSSGCVRVEDASRLAQWLFGHAILGADPTPNRRIDLPEAVPVFITYLTASAADGRIRFLPDIEQRDKT